MVVTSSVVSPGRELHVRVARHGSANLQATMHGFSASLCIEDNTSVRWMQEHANESEAGPVDGSEPTFVVLGVGRKVNLLDEDDDIAIPSVTYRYPLPSLETSPDVVYLIRFLRSEQQHDAYLVVFLFHIV